MPIFRLSKAFGVGRHAKVFFYLQGGFTRGMVPDLDHQGEQAEKLRKALTRNQEQTRKLRQRRLENVQLKNERRAAKERAEST